MGSILYVEDDPRDYRAYAHALELDYHWHIERAEDSREATEKIKGKKFDVVIIDRQMPDPVTGEMRMVGDDLLREIVACWPYLCLIVLTHFSDVEAAQEATRHGAYRYFEKGVSFEKLDRACRKGMQWQLVRGVRHKLLGMTSVKEIIQETKERTLEMFQPAGYGFAYLPLGPGGGLMLGDCECNAESGPVAKDISGGGHFIRKFPVAEEVLTSRQFSLRRLRQEIRPEQGTLIESPGTQLIVPVVQRENESIPAKVTALIWIESVDENAFDRDDAEILSELGDYVGLALATQRHWDTEDRAARDAERKALLAEFAHRIRNPLQTVQSTIDLLSARLDRKDDVPLEDLQEELSKALNGIEQAVQEASELDLGSKVRHVTIQPTDIASLVGAMLDAFEARAASNACAIERSISVDTPLVMLDDREMRYLLTCLLNNALEAIERNRIETGTGVPEQGQIIVSLDADPSRSESVLLSIEDNGCGIAEQDLSRIFQRYYSSKRRDFRRDEQGLGLWDARRLIDALEGSIEARNRPEGGSLFQVVLQACAADETARKIQIK